MTGPPPKEEIDGGSVWYRCQPRMVLGEAPIYRAADSTLHWLDVLKEPCELHVLKIDPETGAADGRARVLELADSVSVVAFRRDMPGSYICAYYQGVAYLDEETGRLDVVKEIIPTEDRDLLRFNDGGVDAKGRFWLAEIDKKAMAYGAKKLPATYGEPKGRVWRYDPDGSLHEMDKDFVCGNGLCWSPDNRTMYINDSVGMKMYAYDFDIDTGNISNRRIFLDRQSSYGEPDGMVVDTEGNLWNAVYGTHRVMVFSPEGEHLKNIVFGARNITCTTWGGRNHDFLFLSTASDQSKNARPEDEGGNIFQCRIERVKGKPKYEFAG